ncbi:hypothetical protein ACLOJK_015031 [Asimina triloba]
MGSDRWIEPPKNDAIVDPVLLWHVSPDGGDSTTAPTVSTTLSSSSSANPSTLDLRWPIGTVHNDHKLEPIPDLPLFSSHDICCVDGRAGCRPLPPATLARL